VWSEDNVRKRLAKEKLMFWDVDGRQTEMKMLGCRMTISFKSSDAATGNVRRPTVVSRNGSTKTDSGTSWLTPRASGCDSATMRSASWGATDQGLCLWTPLGLCPKLGYAFALTIGCQTLALDPPLVYFLRWTQLVTHMLFFIQRSTGSRPVLLTL